MITTRFTAVALALVLVGAACGDTSDAEQLPIDDGSANPAATCPEGTPDCSDTPFVDGEPTDGLPPGDSTGMPVGGGLTVSEALATDATGPLSVTGFYVDSGSGPMLCEALAESFPPQCGGASLPLADLSAVDPESIQSEQGTSWSDDRVFVLGELVDGVLVPTPMSL